MIKISVPNDDSAALFHLGKSLIDLSSTVEGSPGWVVITQEKYNSLQACDSVEIGPVTRSQEAMSDLMQAAPAMLRENDVDGSIEIHGKRKEVEPDTTSKQVESLSSVINREVHFDNPAPQVSDSTTDSNGTPWDERIHSASKALNSDGTWRLRRKPKDMTDDEWTMYVNDVKVEISESQRESDEDDDTLQSPLYEVCPGHIGVMETEPPVAAKGDNSESQRESEELCIDEGCNHHGTPHVCITPEPPVAAKGDDFHVDAGEVTEQQIASIPVPPLPPVPQVEEKTAPDGHEYAHMTFPQVMQFLTERHGRITSAQVDDIIADMGLNRIMDLNTQPEHTGPFIARVKALLGE
jgi:hypothetical protein